MDKRKQKRLRTRILVKIEGKTGILNDYSEGGMQISTNFSPTKKIVDIALNFCGQEVLVKATIQWIRKKFSTQNAYQIGCTVENPPVEYLHFLVER